ncbi:hypothetical protein Vadar_033039 [Vaccinium darrowii]|uniref:Uncharacterized protein n=1 Tax=Vaccinium darrowii TaxID=229202 RepID=A0ACB7YZX4_9ERIC|nr:hypothetical protein Vadar_033039 [Vaccinium darrowii]
MDGNGSESYTLFVDNLPEDVGILWFRNFFNKFGVVIDAFIPSKRSKVTNRRFGFVRYNCATSADVAISKANGFWIEDCKLYVKFAAFKNHSKMRIQNKAGQYAPFNSGVSSRKDVDRSVHRIEKGNPSKQVSYADVVKGSKVSDSKVSLLAKDDFIADNDEWLSRSIIAKLPSPRSVESIKDCFISEGVFDIHIRSLGGNFVVLTFPSLSDMKSMIECTEINWCLCKGNVSLNLDKKVDDQIDDNKGDNLKDDEVAKAKDFLVEPTTTDEQANKRHQRRLHSTRKQPRPPLAART